MEKQMINLSELLDRAKKKALEKPDNKDGYAPKSTDELRFKRKHVVNTTSDANKNGDDVFKGTSVKAVDRAGTRFGYNPGQDEEVYEEVKKKKVCEAKTRMPLDGHPYHNKSDAELKYIIKDAGEAAQAMRGQDSKAENKYLDQVNDASTILAYRQKLQKNSYEPENETYLDESAAPGKEDWIKANKQRFIKQYGKEKGLKILYAKAWAMSKGK